MYTVDIVPEALQELHQAPIYYRRILEKAIELKLIHEPTRASKNCKKLDPLTTDFIYDPPLWELRIGEWRIFYDVEEEEKKVVIRAVRKKPKEKRTEGIV